MRRKIVHIYRFGFARPVTETFVMRNVVNSIAGRKQLKHKNRLYDLSRTDTEISINDYNPILLTAWEENMDIQFIGEKSSLLTLYITNYINKARKCELFDSILNSKNNKNKSLGTWLEGVIE